jgi:hypothetical protein
MKTKTNEVKTMIDKLFLIAIKVILFVKVTKALFTKHPVEKNNIVRFKRGNK